MRSLLNRFSTRLLEEPIEGLKHLQQTGTLQSYCDSFDGLLNRVKLCEEYASGLFVAGLKPEIRCLVKVFKPKNIRDAMAMAKQQEVVYTTLFGTKEFKKPSYTAAVTNTTSKTTALPYKTSIPVTNSVSLLH